MLRLLDPVALLLPLSVGVGYGSFSPLGFDAPLPHPHILEFRHNITTANMHRRATRIDICL